MARRIFWCDAGGVFGLSPKSFAFLARHAHGQDTANVNLPVCSFWESTVVPNAYGFGSAAAIYPGLEAPRKGLLH